jgi:predicted nucleic acid-binding protein
MILVDTSVWVDHLRVGDSRLSALLNSGEVLAHPFVIGEVALGSLKQRTTVLSALVNLPQAPIATDREVLLFIDENGLAGTGIGYVDAHLLASARLGADTTIMTRDRRLHAAAIRLALAA